MGPQYTGKESRNEYKHLVENYLFPLQNRKKKQLIFQREKNRNIFSPFFQQIDKNKDIQLQK